MPNLNWEEEFDKLEWPMHLAGTGVDMGMVERDKQVKSFLVCCGNGEQTGWTVFREEFVLNLKSKGLIE